MKILGRHATEEEKENMLNPFFTNHGEEWTPEFIRFCIEKGSNYISENMDLYEIFHDTDNSPIK